MGARAAGGTSCVQIEHSEEDIPGASSEPMEYDPSPVQFRNCLQQRHGRFKVGEGSQLPPPKVWELVQEKKDKTGLGFSSTSYVPKPGLKDRLEIPPLSQIFVSAGFINAPPPEVKTVESDAAATLEYTLSQLSIDDHLSKLSLDSPMSDSPKEMAMMPPMTSKAIDLAERKMNLSLDDIIKMSKKSSSSKARKPRASNKSGRFPPGNASQGNSSKVLKYMECRSSLRQGVLAKRRSNSQGNQFPLTAEAARNAAVAPIHNGPLSCNRVVNWNEPRLITCASVNVYW